MTSQSFDLMQDKGVLIHFRASREKLHNVSIALRMSPDVRGDIVDDAGSSCSDSPLSQSASLTGSPHIDTFLRDHYLSRFCEESSFLNVRSDGTD
jgi:hypothetical protein